MSKLRGIVSKIVAAALLVAGAGSSAGANLREGQRLERAHAHFVHHRVREWLGDQPAYRDDAGQLVAGRRWVTDERTGAVLPDSRDVILVGEDDAYNVKTTAGIDFLFAQGYSTTPGANGLNYIALSNDTLTETSASTTLSTEIATNGLARAQGTYAHTGGASTSTVAHTFTASGAQSAQKAALFSASSAGTMNHALSFTQRALQNGDTLAVTFTITIS